MIEKKGGKGKSQKKGKGKVVGVCSTWRLQRRVRRSWQQRLLPHLVVEGARGWTELWSSPVRKFRRDVANLEVKEGSQLCRVVLSGRLVLPSGCRGHVGF
ncbi:hypothetical protein VNO78_09764 [Psophocarpus tetragonolobus]|uniref:Uncharacterized protein n=1 Tax=Psophocarpus tetragonolobus TaxID=3891 RepID=A0AAN9T8M8_PSOTE